MVANARVLRAKVSQRDFSFIGESDHFRSVEAAIGRPDSSPSKRCRVPVNKASAGLAPRAAGDGVERTARFAPILCIGMPESAMVVVYPGCAAEG
jgi:hypothetical protein